MPLIRAFSYTSRTHENIQFREFVDQIYQFELNKEKSIPDYKPQWIVIIQGYEFKGWYSKNSRPEKAETDILVIRENGISFIETKSYDSAKVISASEKEPWTVINTGGTSQTLTSGGNANKRNPFQQVLRTREILFNHLKRKAPMFTAEVIEPCWQKKNYLSSMVWFCRDLKLESSIAAKFNSYFRIVPTKLIVDTIFDLNDGVTIISPKHIGMLLNELEVDKEYHTSRMLSEGCRPLIPGYIRDQVKIHEQSSSAVSGDELKQAENITDFRSDEFLEQRIPGVSGEVLFPTASSSAVKLHMMRVIVRGGYVDPAQPFTIKQKNGGSFPPSSIRDVLEPARAYESEDSPPVRVELSSSDFQGRSHELSMAIADQLARHQSLLEDGEMVLASGRVEEHGFVHPVTFIQEKLEAALYFAAEHRICHVVISKENRKDLTSEMEDKLIAAGINLHAIEQVSDLVGELWNSGITEQRHTNSNKEISSPQLEPTAFRRAKPFFAIGAVSMLALVGVLTFRGNLEVVADAVLPKSITEQITYQHQVYLDDPDNWMALQTLITLANDATPTEYSVISKIIRERIEQARKRAGKSDTRLNRLTAGINEADTEKISSYQLLTEALKALTTLDRHRLESTSPDILEQAVEKSAIYEAWKLAEKVRNNLPMQVVSKRYRQYQHMDKATQEAFQSHFPEQYQVIESYPDSKQQSDKRLAELSVALEAYRVQSKSEKPSPVVWPALIAAWQQLLPIDKSMLVGELAATEQYAQRAFREWEDSSNRIARLTRAVSAKKDSLQHVEVTKALSVLKPLDKERLAVDSPATLSTAKDIEWQYELQAFASQISTQQGPGYSELKLKEFNKFNEKSKLAFQQQYPAQYQVLIQFKQEKENSSARLSKLLTSAKSYRGERYASYPNPAMWHLLIEAAGRITEFDRLRLNSELSQALRYANKAQEELNNSRARIDELFRTAVTYQGLINNKQYDSQLDRAELEVRAAVSNITSLDYARLTGKQSEIFDYLREKFRLEQPKPI